MPLDWGQRGAWAHLDAGQTQKEGSETFYAWGPENFLCCVQTYNKPLHFTLAECQGFHCSLWVLRPWESRASRLPEGAYGERQACCRLRGAAPEGGGAKGHNSKELEQPSGRAVTSKGANSQGPSGAEIAWILWQQPRQLRAVGPPPPQGAMEVSESHRIRDLHDKILSFLRT